MPSKKSAPSSAKRVRDQGKDERAGVAAASSVNPVDSSKRRKVSQTALPKTPKEAYQFLKDHPEAASDESISSMAALYTTFDEAVRHHLPELRARDAPQEAAEAEQRRQQSQAAEDQRRRANALRRNPAPQGSGAQSSASGSGRRASSAGSDRNAVPASKGGHDESKGRGRSRSQRRPPRGGHRGKASELNCLHCDGRHCITRCNLFQRNQDQQVNFGFAGLPEGTHRVLWRSLSGKLAKILRHEKQVPGMNRYREISIKVFGMLLHPYFAESGLQAHQVAQMLVSIPMKKRYYLATDKTVQDASSAEAMSEVMIGALIGHSQLRPVDSGHFMDVVTTATYEQMAEMARQGVRIVHGTSVMNAASIRAQGLNCGRRTMVHWVLTSSPHMGRYAPQDEGVAWFTLDLDVLKSLMEQGLFSVQLMQNGTALTPATPSEMLLDYNWLEPPELAPNMNEWLALQDATQEVVLELPKGKTKTIKLEQPVYQGDVL